MDITFLFLLYGKRYRTISYVLLFVGHKGGKL